MSAMKDALSLLLTLSLLTLAAPPAASRQAHGDSPRRLRHERAAAGSYIVVLKSGTDASEVAAAAERLTHLHGGRLVATYKHALKGFSVQLGERAAEALSRHPLVAYVEDDALVELASTTQTNAPWGLDRIDQRDLPLSNTYTYANSGAGAHVYIIDSGIRTTHDEFGGRASVAFDNVGDSQNGEDCFGHGTQVAGVVGGATYGVAKGAELHAVRVFSCTNTSTLTKVIGGVDFVTSDHLSPAVAVLSVSTGGSTSLDTAVENSIAAGVTYVVAAGNINVDAGTRSPGRVADAVTVGATDSTDTRASFSNYGSSLDLFAPGVDIPTANWFSDSSTITQSGTSLAAAHTAGVAARYLSGNPQETPAEVSASLTGNATVGAVINPGTDSPNLLLYRPRGKTAYELEPGEESAIFTINSDGTGLTRLTSNMLAAHDPEWSPDGTKIAFTRSLPGSSEVYVMDADGTNPVNLTNHPTWDSEPTWSPDGSKIAFVSNRDAAGEIYTMNADGTNVTRLTNNTASDFHPAWSHGGTKIAFASLRDGNQEIYVMNANGTGQTRLTNNSAVDWSPTWSPDDSKIALIRFTTSAPTTPADVWVMNADGTGQTNVSNTSANDFDPSWSAANGKIAFSGEGNGQPGIYVMNSNGSGTTLLTEGTYPDRDPFWSPDGSKIVFTSERDSLGREVAEVNVDGTDEVTLSNDGGGDITPAWSPDGRKVAFASDRDNGTYDLFVMNSDGTGQVQLTDTSDMDEYVPVWSPDGSKIVFETYNYNNDRQLLYVINADGTNRVQLSTTTIYQYTASWSPDGSKILFDGYGSGAGNVYTVNPDGSGQVNLTPAAGNDYTASWSPDGTKIVFTTTRDGNEEIYVMNANGSSQTRLTNDVGSDDDAVWSPDGTKIAFITNRGSGVNSEIYVMNANGSSQTNITNTTAIERSPEWSPDGTKIVFVSGRSGPDRVYLMNPDGTNVVQLTNLGGQNRNPRWQPL